MNIQGGKFTDEINEFILAKQDQQEFLHTLNQIKELGRHSAYSRWNEGSWDMIPVDTEGSSS